MDCDRLRRFSQKVQAVAVDEPLQRVITFAQRIRDRSSGQDNEATNGHRGLQQLTRTDEVAAMGGNRRTGPAGGGSPECACMQRPVTADSCPPQPSGRRELLGAAFVGGLGLSLSPQALAADPRMTRPQPGDRFVFAHGEKARKVISDTDLTPGGPPVLAWPMDPASKTIRDGSRLNQVLILRLDAAEFDERTRERATADGIVAYSASCTHALCPVTGWKPDKQIVHCPCHNSEFDPRVSAKVVFGPAPRPLPALPLKAGEGGPVVAAPFTGRVGAGV
jgi:rieske iron-sulfur protein